MRDIEVDFLEEYIKLDNLLEQVFSCDSGVTTYISRMEEKQYAGMYAVGDWKYVYKQLKHVRWIRNNISHEGYSECDQDDLDFVLDFYDAVMKCNDPLAKLYQRQKKEDKPKQHIENNNTSKQKKNDKGFGVAAVALIISILLIGFAIYKLLKYFIN